MVNAREGTILRKYGISDIPAAAPGRHRQRERRASSGGTQEQQGEQQRQECACGEYSDDHVALSANVLARGRVRPWCDGARHAGNDVRAASERWPLSVSWAALDVVVVTKTPPTPALRRRVAPHAPPSPSGQRPARRGRTQRPGARLLLGSSKHSPLAATPPRARGQVAQIPRRRWPAVAQLHRPSAGMLRSLPSMQPSGHARQMLGSEPSAGTSTCAAVPSIAQRPTSPTQ